MEVSWNKEFFKFKVNSWNSMDIIKILWGGKEVSMEKVC